MKQFLCMKSNLDPRQQHHCGVFKEIKFQCLKQKNFNNDADKVNSVYSIKVKQIQNKIEDSIIDFNVVNFML